ncbi:receptor-type tyrosine-protein phosphatase alpha-like [Callorhinchus milii]|uniref:receptor-type tyrosine-protein phosphatase alpha-like n=1 Tax=Callorhinchus milii TaxID=7868 RepID=UPI001C3FC31E|nr:receptor-type tyrosine-protein phosphatase alpha-like [Callorhinchus milii]
MKSSNSNEGFLKEFEKLKDIGKDQSSNIALLMYNKVKNRYSNILPYDWSRIKLSGSSMEPGLDYINANLIPGYNSARDYIATQGPLKNTVNDFWRMVWEYNACCIVMLTNLIENNRVTCEKYWPTNKLPIQYGQIYVSVLKVEKFKEWTKTEMMISHINSKPGRTICHYQFVDWPDYGVPQSINSLVDFTEVVQKATESVRNSGPIVVHCSAGVGRSGSFIALSYSMNLIATKGIVNVFGQVYTMRRCRTMMVQTLDQYVFLHTCILNIISTNKEKHAKRKNQVPLIDFPVHCMRLAANSNMGFLEDFELIGQAGRKQPKTAGLLPGNANKNRYKDVVPYEHSRVKLPPSLNDPSSDYINANFIAGYNSDQEYIATQGPLKETLADFWRMIWTYNVSIIVMLTRCEENGKKKCEEYWPLDRNPQQFGDILVQVMSQNMYPEYIDRQFKVIHVHYRAERIISHFHFLGWPDHGVPSPMDSIISFVAGFRHHAHFIKKSGPTVVHCSAGVGRTGTFIGLDCLLQQIRNEQTINVFEMVHRMRLNRCFMVQTLDQYMLLHTCIRNILTQNS